MCSSILYLSWHYMELSGQLHVLATLLLSRELSLSLRFEAGWAPEPL
jgi:hypothetical protein